MRDWVVVRTSGAPRRIGIEHGRAAADLVKSNLDLYFRRFAAEWGLSRDVVLERAQAYAEVIRRSDPAYAEMVEGVAEGSGQSSLDVYALNVRYEIMYSEYARMGKLRETAPSPDGCTAVGLLPDRTSEGRLLMAQNWDWIPGVHPILLQVRPGDGPEVLAFTEAGIVGPKIGVNDRGIGLLINGLVSNADAWDRLGLPFHVRCWRILTSTTFGDARRHALDGRGSCSANFMIGQTVNGVTHLADFETSPRGAVELLPRGGALVHANHFLRGEEQGIQEPLLSERPSTLQRHGRMEHLLGGTVVNTDVLKGFLRDHTGRPNSICRHPDESLPPSEHYETVVSVVLDPQERAIHVAHGNPCRSEYRTVTLRLS